MKKIIALIVVLAAVAAAIIWWRKPAAAAAADEDEKPTASVEISPLQMQTVSHTLSTIGVVEPSAAGSAAVTLSYDAVIKSVSAPAGSRVEAGEVIMEVEPTPDAKLNIDSAKGAAKLAEDALASTQQRFDLKLATSDELHTAQQAAADAKLKVDSFVKRGLADGKILAPAAGIVVKLDGQPGAVVPAGTSLVTLGNASLFQARLSVEVADSASLKKGQKVTITPITRGDADEADAEITSVGATVDPATGAADVRVLLPADGTWYAGEHVRGEIETESKVTLAVPRAAVLPDDDKEVLYTVTDHKATRHEVTVGLTSANWIEVSSKELKVGDFVVIEGNYELADGMTVQLPGEGDKDAPDEDAAKPDDKADAKADKPAAKADAKTDTAKPEGK
jgi:RND family efflux transporter MFP subunit